MRQLTVLQNSPQEILRAEQSVWQQLFTAVITVNTVVCELSYQQTLLNLLLELPQYQRTASNSATSFSPTPRSTATGPYRQREPTVKLAPLSPCAVHHHRYAAAIHLPEVT